MTSEARGPWFKVKAGAEYAGIKPRLFRQWLKAGLTHSHMGSGVILVSRQAIDEYIRRFEVAENRIDNLVDEAVKGL